ncbi:MAG TPA: UDP-glucose 4-epimerase GalE, partial [Rikenellaceae bacterium]|nr:UDP-glucose 4-epimerase GalE [Rikenellaceae bacterium]
AGYIGAHCCKQLRSSGYNPVVLDNLICGHREAVRWGEFIHADICDPAAIDQVFKTWSIGAVMHFSAFAYVGESVISPEKYYRNNLCGTINLLNCMVRNNIDKLVFSSTCATYGNPVYTPIDEKHIQKPINPYGRSKLMVENILEDYGRAYGLRFFSLRYFNAAGADHDCEVGEKHDPETHLIPLVLDVALGKRTSIQIFGSDYPTPDGTCIRDYIHVSDLADAHIKALQLLFDGGGSDFYNLGTGKGCSVLEVINVAELVTGKKIRIEKVNRREGDPAELVASNAKALASLNWQPRFSTIDEIFSTAWKWHQKNHRR